MVHHHYCLVLAICQLVMEHTHTLVSPQPHKAGRLIISVSDRQTEPMVDTREVSEVKYVVKLGGCWWKITDDAIIQLQCCCGNDLRQVLYTYCTDEKIEGIQCLM